MAPKFQTKKSKKYTKINVKISSKNHQKKSPKLKIVQNFINISCSAKNPLKSSQKIHKKLTKSAKNP